MAGERTSRRTELKEETRRRLLDAAETAFAERGFAGAALEEIAERAGYTRGAVYYNFADKDELFVAVLDRHFEQSSREVAALVDGDGDPVAFFTALRRRSADHRRDDAFVDQAYRWAVLLEEFWLYATRNESARKRLAEYQHRQLAAYAKAINAIADRAGFELPMPAEHLASVVLAIDDGLPRQRWLDPAHVPEGLLFDTLSFLVDAMAALTTRRRPARDKR